MGLWWGLVAIGVLALLVYALRRDPSLNRWRWATVTLMMTIGLIGPLLIALNPVWVEPLPAPEGKPKITVLLDGTASMAVEDALSKSRWERGLELTTAVQSADTSIDVTRQVFDGTGVQPLAGFDRTTGQGHRTDLAEAIGGVLRSGSPVGHAVLLISDGAHNAGSSQAVVALAREANSLGTPIYTATLGSKVGMKNLSLAARSPRMIAFPNSPLHIRVRLGHAGLAGQSTELLLLDEEDRVVDRRKTRLTDDPNQEIRFSIPDGPTRSLQRYHIVASEVAGEATTSDNQTTVLVQRLEAPIDVLLLEGKPYWDSKFLARNLGSDPMVRLTSITRLGAQRFLQRQAPRSDGDEAGSTTNESGAPGSNDIGSAQTPNATDAKTESGRGASSVENWAIHTELESPLDRLALLEQYRLVILGRDSDRFLTTSGVENLRKWIAESGGCLVCARGAPSDEIATRLAEILPVRWIGQSETRFRTRVSQFGVDAAVFDPLLSGGRDPLATLPSLASTARPASRPGLPQILIQSVADRSGQSVPVVTYQPYGSGQSIVVEGAGMWRWAFLPPEHANKDGIYRALWKSLIGWVISSQDFLPGQRVAIRADRATFLAGDRVTASVLVRQPREFLNAEGKLELTALLQTAEEDLPRRFSAGPSGLEENLYRVDFGSLPVGVHSARIVHGDRDRMLASTSIEVRDPWFESLEVDSRPELMRSIAQISGGEVIEPEQVSDIAERFEQRLKQNRPQKLRRTSLWDRPSVLLLVLGGWMATWIIRRRNGLI